MKYLIVYVIGFVLTFGYLASTNDTCFTSISFTSYECRAWFAFPRAMVWPAYWTLLGSWEMFDLMLGETKGPYD